MPRPAPVTLLSRSAFLLICSLMVWPPLLRGSVHGWHQGLIQIVTLLAVLALIMERYLFSKRRVPWVGTPWDGPIIALLGLILISTFRSPHTALAMEGGLMGFTYIAIHYVTRQAVRTRQEKRIVIYTIGGAALLMSLIAVLKLNDATPFSWWIYPGLPSPTRASGPYGNPNHLAGFLEMALPMVLILFLNRKRRWEMTFGLILAAIFLLIVQGMTLSPEGDGLPRPQP